MEVISKETFVEIIDDLKRADKYQDDLNKFFRDNGVDGYIYQPDCSCSVIKLLELMFGKNNDMISYFCFELGYGKKWEYGAAKDSSGNDIKLETSEDLYDYLVSDR